MAKKQTKSISPKREVERNTPKIKNLQPSIKPKILELMAKEMSNLWTKEKLIDFLINCGIDKRLIKDSQIKWKIAYNVLQKLNISNQPNGEKILFKIIEDAVHPLAHEGDRLSAETLLNKFSEYLSYDNYKTVFDEKGNRYKFYLNRTNEELNEIVAELDEEKDKRAKEQLKFLSQPDNKEKISLLLTVFQLLMNTIKIFCADPSNPTRKLNNAYQFLDKQIWNIIHDLNLRGDTVIYNFNKYKYIFFDFFSAEKQYAEQNKELSWEKIKPEMNAMYGQIDNICQKVGADSTIIDLKKYEDLKNIQSYLSSLKKKTQTRKNKPTFDLKKSLIIAGDKKCKIPFDTKQYDLCKIMFSKKINERVEWIEIADSWKGHSIGKYKSKRKDFNKGAWREVYDVVNAINKKVMLKLDIKELFKYKDKSVKRLI